MIQLASNRNFFTGEDIEMAVAPGSVKRFEADTPKIAVGIGDLFNLSPHGRVLYARYERDVVNQVFMATDMIAGQWAITRPCGRTDGAAQNRGGEGRRCPLWGALSARAMQQVAAASEQVNPLALDASAVLAESDRDRVSEYGREPTSLSTDTSYGRKGRPDHRSTHGT